MKVTIKKTGINGEGIGYIDRMPVFVPQALIGEEVEIRIVDKQKRYATAELLRVVKSSKNRIRPKCFIQNTCGACPTDDCPLSGTAGIQAGSVEAVSDKICANRSQKGCPCKG